MIRKLNAYFIRKKGLTDERSYAQDSTAPYRLNMIKKYLGSWSRMIGFLGFYYPQWKEIPVVEEPEVEKKVVFKAKKKNDG